ncbi:hypothetical protein CR513_42732, partial [Mucuna pruriens]
MFRKVEINVPLLDAIKQIPKYAKFLKELCLHKRKKMKGGEEVGGVVLVLTRNEIFITGAKSLPKKCKDPRIFSVPCTIGECTFADAILDLGASINVMPTSINKALNFGDLEPTRMTIQLANRSILQPLGILEDVLVQVDDLIFPADFYVLDMEDETFGKGSTLILGTPFLGSIHAEVKVAEIRKPFSAPLATIFSTEGDSANKGRDQEKTKVNSAKKLTDKADMNVETILGTEDQMQVRVVSTVPSGSDIKAEQKAESDSIPARTISVRRSRPKQPKAEVMTAHLVSSSSQDGQPDPKASTTNSSSPPPPMELKPLQNHLKYAYLDNEQQLSIIIANNLHQEQEDKLLDVLRQHKKAIGWKLSDLPSINPSICMHKILMVEEVKPIRKQQRRLNPIILDVVKKEVTKLLAAGIMYPISDSQWVSPVQVVPKKSGMTVMKNQHDEMVPMRIQNSWRVCVDYRRLNQANH